MDEDFRCGLLDLAAEHLAGQIHCLFFNDLLVTIIKVKVKSLGSSLIINAFEGIKNRIVAEFNPIESVAFASDQPFLCGLIEQGLNFMGRFLDELTLKSRIGGSLFDEIAYRG